MGNQSSIVHRMNFEDIQNDPDYSNWGPEPASVNYIGIIPYLIKSIQEKQTDISDLTKENMLLNEKVEKINNLIVHSSSFEEFKSNFQINL